MLRDLLRSEGFTAGRKHIGTLMAKMGIEAVYRRPNTSRAHPTNPVYPYLLRDLSIERSNQVWALDGKRSIKTLSSAYRELTGRPRITAERSEDGSCIFVRHGGNARASRKAVVGVVAVSTRSRLRYPRESVRARLQ